MHVYTHTHTHITSLLVPYQIVSNLKTCNYLIKNATYTVPMTIPISSSFSHCYKRLVAVFHVNSNLELNYEIQKAGKKSDPLYVRLIWRYRFSRWMQLDKERTCTAEWFAFPYWKHNCLANFHFRTGKKWKINKYPSTWCFS